MTKTDGIQRTRFETHSLAVPDRFAAWRESASVTYDVSPYDENTAMSFNALVDSMLLDDIVIMRCKLGAQMFDRSMQRIVRDGVDHFQLHVFLSGSVEMDFNGHASKAQAGTWINIDHSEPFASRTTDYEVLNMFIPRRRLEPQLLASSRVHGAVFGAGDGAGRLLYDYVVSLVDVANMITRLEAPKAAEALVLLCALALNGASFDQAGPPETANHALLIKAQVFVKNNLHDPDLSPDIIAGGLGLSRSRLYRIFSEHGGIADYIREMRLRRSYTDLISPRHFHLQVAQIAYRWGFTDPGSFSKAFKRRFGVSPTDVRIHGASAFSKGLSDDSFARADMTFSRWIGDIG